MTLADKLGVTLADKLGVTLADKPPIELTLEEKLPNMLIADDGRFGRPRLSEFGSDTCNIYTGPSFSFALSCILVVHMIYTSSNSSIIIVII